MANTRKRNRLSICKAVETLEAAGRGPSFLQNQSDVLGTSLELTPGLGDEPDRKAVSQQLEMVQKRLGFDHHRALMWDAGEPRSYVQVPPGSQEEAPGHCGKGK